MKQVCKPPASPLRIARFMLEAQVRLALQGNRTATGVWLRRELVHLGPAFVKLGQFVSTRSDLLPKPISKELVRLQDDMQPIDFDDIRCILDESLLPRGQRMDDVFLDFETAPLAVASIGQVHRAVLKETGQAVAIKVQKPCVAAAMQSDMANLEAITRWMAMISPKKQEMGNVIDQYSQFLSAELDFEKELQNMVAFSKSVETYPALRIPRVYPALSSQHVLVMEFVPSIKISDLDTLRRANIDMPSLAVRLIEGFLHQIVKTGVIHCDPHPGNIGVMEDGQTIVLYDFGNVITLSRAFRDEIRNLVFAVTQKDVQQFVDLLIKLQVVRIDDNDERQELQDFFTYFFEYLSSLNIATLQASIRNNELLGQAKANMKLDSNFVALVRVFSLLDGTCSMLDINFSYYSALMPFATEFMQDIRFFDFRARKDLELLQSIPKMMQNADQSLVRVNRRVKNMNANMSTMRMLLLASMAFDVFYTREPVLIASSMVAFVAVALMTKPER